MASFYDIVEKDIHGNDLPYSVFRDKVVYGLNVASRCSFSPAEYRRLKELGEAYKGRNDLAIIGYPSGQFANQECSENEDIIKHAMEHGPASMVLMSKADVKGKKARPTYRWLAENAATPVDTRWNFRGKFVVNKEGTAYGTTDPEALIPKFL